MTIPTKNELLKMFEALINCIEDRNMFGKEWEFETEHLKVYLKDKNCLLVLFANYGSFQKESIKLKGENNASNSNPNVS